MYLRFQDIIMEMTAVNKVASAIIERNLPDNK